MLGELGHCLEYIVISFFTLEVNNTTCSPATWEAIFGKKKKPQTNKRNSVLPSFYSFFLQPRSASKSWAKTTENLQDYYYLLITLKGRGAVFNDIMSFPPYVTHSEAASRQSEEVWWSLKGIITLPCTMFVTIKSIIRITSSDTHSLPFN